MASRHLEICRHGARVAGISVDSVGQNAAMVAKLRLPFPLLSDPGGERAVKPYGVWHAEERGGIARPAVIIVEPGGEEAFRFVARDFADRIPEDDVVAAVERLELPPAEQPAPATGTAEPGREAMPLGALRPYFRGAKFAAKAMGLRVPEAKAEADALGEEMNRYSAAVKALSPDRE